MSTPLLVLDPSSGVAPYVQIASQVRLAIASKRLHAGNALPSVRQLARDLGVAPNTVARAYSELEREGWVITSLRRGVAVAERLPSRDATARYEELRAAVAELLLRAHTLGVAPDALRAELDRQLAEQR